MFERIIEKIKGASRIGLFAHVNPDGDALGSIYSLKYVLETMGKQTEVYLDGRIQSGLLELIGDGTETTCRVDECDLLIALDSSDKERLGVWSEEFLKHKNTAAVDHHITHKQYANEAVVRDISSNCELLYAMYKEMNVIITPKAASALYTGMVTDTGGFKYSSVTPKTHRVAAELIELGADFANITKKVFDTKTKEYLKILQLAISRIQYYCDGKIAYLRLDAEDFENCGIEEADAGGIVSLPGTVEGVEVTIYVRRRGEDEYKVSLRSSGDTDVAKIALEFGGGGHVKASGFSLKATELDEGLNTLVSKISKELGCL